MSAAIGGAGRPVAGDQEHSRNACRCRILRQNRRCARGRRVQRDCRKVPCCQRQDGRRSVNRNPGPLGQRIAVSCMRTERIIPCTSVSGPRTVTTGTSGSRSSGTAPRPGEPEVRVLGLKPDIRQLLRRSQPGARRRRLPVESLQVPPRRASTSPAPRPTVRTAVVVPFPRRCRRNGRPQFAAAPPSPRTGTITATADRAVNTKNIHIPVASASPSPRATGSTAPSTSAARPPCSAARGIFRGSATDSPAEPRQDALAPGGPATRTDSVDFPHRMSELVEMTAFLTRLPSTFVPLALSRSRIVMAVSETSILACSPGQVRVRDCQLGVGSSDPVATAAKGQDRSCTGSAVHGQQQGSGSIRCVWAEASPASRRRRQGPPR